MKHLLFVYGTLMSGFGNNRLLLGAKPVTTATLPGTLYASGIPFFKYDPDSPTEVEGEVWEVDDATLRACDRLEGYDPARPHDADDWYTRITVTHPIIGDVYVYAVRAAPSYSTIVESGRYREYAQGLKIGA